MFRNLVVFSVLILSPLTAFAGSVGCAESGVTGHGSGLTSRALACKIPTVEADSERVDPSNTMLETELEFLMPAEKHLQEILNLIESPDFEFTASLEHFFLDLLRLVDSIDG